MSLRRLRRGDGVIPSPAAGDRSRPVDDTARAAGVFGAGLFVGMVTVAFSRPPTVAAQLPCQPAVSGPRLQPVEHEESSLLRRHRPPSAVTDGRACQIDRNRDRIRRRVDPVVRAPSGSESPTTVTFEFNVAAASG